MCHGNPPPTYRTRGWPSGEVFYPSPHILRHAKPAGGRSSLVLPAVFSVIAKAATHTGGSSVIGGLAGACHHSRELPSPEWSCAYSTRVR